MTLAAVELEAENMAWTRDETRHGYGFRSTTLGRVRVTHRRGPERKKGQRAYYLNHVEISRHRAASLLA